MSTSDNADFCNWDNTGPNTSSYIYRSPLADAYYAVFCPNQTKVGGKYAKDEEAIENWVLSGNAWFGWSDYLEKGFSVRHVIVQELDKEISDEEAKIKVSQNRIKVLKSMK